jgi:hypothetical protein
LRKKKQQGMMPKQDGKNKFLLKLRLQWTASISQRPTSSIDQFIKPTITLCLFQHLAQQCTTSMISSHLLQTWTRGEEYRFIDQLCQQ